MIVTFFKLGEGKKTPASRIGAVGIFIGIRSRNEEQEGKTGQEERRGTEGKVKEGQDEEEKAKSVSFV